MLKKILSSVFLFLSKIFFFRCKSFSHDKCIFLLEKNDYIFNPLWEEIRPLHPNEIDLSIIVPVYNSEKYLENCLSSLLSQKTSYVYEVICINDGSSDGSELILKKFQEQYPMQFRYVNQNNQGISAARNTGIVLAKGEYVGFVDNDDTVLEYYVERVLKTAKETHADIVQTAFYKVNELGEVLDVCSHGDYLLNYTNELDWSEKMFGFVWGGVLKKSIFRYVRFPVGFWFEDMITRMLFMRMCDKIVIIGQPLYKYLVHKNNASKVLWKCGNIKAADQYWLAKSFADFSIHNQGFSPDIRLYDVLLKEWSVLLYHRTKGLPTKIKRALFFLASEYMIKIGFRTYYKKGLQKEILKSFELKNYYKWKCASIAYTFHLSINNVKDESNSKGNFENRAHFNQEYQ